MMARRGSLGCVMLSAWAPPSTCWPASSRSRRAAQRLGLEWVLRPVKRAAPPLAALRAGTTAASCCSSPGSCSGGAVRPGPPPRPYRRSRRRAFVGRRRRGARATARRSRPGAERRHPQARSSASPSAPEVAQRVLPERPAHDRRLPSRASAGRARGRASSVRAPQAQAGAVAVVQPRRRDMAKVAHRRCWREDDAAGRDGVDERAAVLDGDPGVTTKYLDAAIAACSPPGSRTSSRSGPMRRVRAAARGRGRRGWSSPGRCRPAAARPAGTSRAAVSSESRQWGKPRTVRRVRAKPADRRAPEA